MYRLNNIGNNNSTNKKDFKAVCPVFISLYNDRGTIVEGNPGNNKLVVQIIAGIKIFALTLDRLEMGGYISFVRIQPGEAMRSPQEIFTFVLESLRAQGKQAIDNHGHCRLRGEGGTKCAVGFLIPDSEYSPDFDTSDFLQTEKAKDFREICENDSLMHRLVSLHDVDYNWAKNLFEKRFSEKHPFSSIGIKSIKQTAEDFGLTSPDWV